MTAAGLDVVSDGRCTLGLRTSGPQAVEGWHGVPRDALLQRIREIVEICRLAWRHGRLEHAGRTYPIPLLPEQGTGLVTVPDLDLSGRKDEAAPRSPTNWCVRSRSSGLMSCVAERIAACAEAGVTTLALQPLDDSRENRLRTVATMRELCNP
jgi:hypothetical protein